MASGGMRNQQTCGVIASVMGVPLNRLVCAVNENDIGGMRNQQVVFLLVSWGVPLNRLVCAVNENDILYFLELYLWVLSI